MTKSSLSVVPAVAFMLLVANCGGDGDPTGVGGAGGGRDFDSGAGAPSTGGSSSNGGAGAVAGSSGSNSVGGSTGVGGGAGASGTGGGEGGTGAIVGSGGTGTGGTVATGGTGGTFATGGAAGSTGGTVATGGTGGGVTPSVTAVAWLEPDSCDQGIAYEVQDVRDQIGALVSSYTCEWMFDDTTTSNTCTGEHFFGEGGSHTASVTVRDSTTGATTTATAPTVLAIEQLDIETFGSSDACLQLSYSTNRQFGYGTATYFVDIQPAANVVTPGPWPEDATGIMLSAPGTYSVQVRAETYPPGRVCTASSGTSITVADCP